MRVLPYLYGEAGHGVQTGGGADGAAGAVRGVRPLHGLLERGARQQPGLDVGVERAGRAVPHMAGRPVADGAVGQPPRVLGRVRLGLGWRTKPCRNDKFRLIR